MFAIGDCVIHPGQGLCTVVGFKDEPTQTIILEAGSGVRTTRIMYPVAMAAKALHYPVSREEALSVIKGYSSIECDSHSEHNSGLEEQYFKKLVKQGVPHSVMVVKTMTKRIKDAEAAGKKPSTYYTRVLKEAQTRSLEELAYALDSTPEDVVEMFETQDMSA